MTPLKSKGKISPAMAGTPVAGVLATY